MTTPDLPRRSTDISQPPEPLVSNEDWSDFCEWARDGGYDQSYFNRWDSKSLALQQQYLGERDEHNQTESQP